MGRFNGYMDLKNFIRHLHYIYFSRYKSRVFFALELEPLIAKKAKENQGTRTDITSVRNLTNVDTKKELASIAGVSHDTIAKVKSIF